jgi:hypothetical protein
MNPLDFAVGRVDAFIAEIERLKESEFPYHHSAEALDLLLERYQRERKTLTRLRSKPAETIKTRCAVSLTSLTQDLPLLGFILRSTNVRNAFEVYGPLLEIARKLLGETTRLLLSSEWQYSPHTYPYSSIPHLPDFVLIGLPAPESSNPLLIPLSGHELGHSLWKLHNVESKLRKKITDAVIDVIRKKPDAYNEHYQHLKVPLEKLDQEVLGYRIWEPAAALATRQAEESFCDFVALKLFGYAFARAFGYLVSPGTSGRRSGQYPNFVKRADNLKRAAKKYGVWLDPAYQASFQNLADPKTTPDRLFLVGVADDALEAVLEDLIGHAAALTPEGLASPPAAIIETCRQRLEQHVPAEKSGGLAAILNAGWLVYNHLAEHAPPTREATRALFEVTLKSIEVLEIETIIRDQP